MNNSEPINEERLSAYLDGELSKEESLRVEKRIEQDESLRRILSEIEKIRDEIRQLPRHKLSNDFAAKITQSIEQQPPKTPPQPIAPRITTPRRIAAILAAIAALLLISVWGIFNNPLRQITAMSESAPAAANQTDAADEMKSDTLKRSSKAVLQEPDIAPTESGIATLSQSMDSELSAAPAAMAAGQQKFHRGMAISGYDLVIDFEMNPENLNSVSTAWSSLKKMPTSSEADSKVTEYVIEGTPEEIRTKLAALRSAPIRQLAETQLGRQYQNVFFENMERFRLSRDNEKLVGPAGTTTLRHQAPTTRYYLAPGPSDEKAFSDAPPEAPVQARVSAATAEADHSYEADDQLMERIDDAEVETKEEPIRMRILVRVSSKETQAEAIQP